VEFIVDKEVNFYFIEVNARIQVEHPVTEMITGIDLVREQLRVAAGEQLGYTQDDVRSHGHAIEVRINAENPFQGFLPSTGTISNLRNPAGPWTRFDSAMYRGMEVGLAYDPMLAKLIVHAPTREIAIERMSRALEEVRILGIETSIPFHLAVMADHHFRSGDFDIHYLTRMADELLAASKEARIEVSAALAAALIEHETRKRGSGTNRISDAAPSASAWKRPSSWRAG
jgi:acetyl-CoA carboxylase biotin carboxylase subunit